MRSDIMNIPNLLTLFRLFLVPVFILTFFSGIQNSFSYSIIIFLAAGFTDVLDGYIARKYNLITRWGMLFDPFADKLMLLTVLSCLVIRNTIPLWVLLVIASKEIFMIAAGTVLQNNDVVIPSNIAGKLTTFLFYISIFLLVYNKIVGIYLIYVAVGSAVFALLNYLNVYFRRLYLHKEQ
jgi:cardiolipin synthase (CMP-forming)